MIKGWTVALCRLEVEVQVVAKSKDTFTKLQLEASLFELGADDANLVNQEKVKIQSDDHWVSVDMATKVDLDDAWYGGVFKVPLLPPFLPINKYTSATSHKHRCKCSQYS